MIPDIAEYSKSLDPLIVNKNNEFNLDDLQDALAMCQFLINKLQNQNAILLKAVDDAIATCENILSS